MPDARDRLTAILIVARRNGVRVEARLFATGDLARQVQDVRATLQALDGQLALVEDMARREG